MNLLQQSYLNVKGGRESSLLQSLLLPSPRDPINREVTVEPVSPAAYTSPEQPHLTTLPPGYPMTIPSSDAPFYSAATKLPNTLRVPPPSLTLQPPTSPPCVQSFEDDFQPPSSPSDILSHYGFSSNLSSPGIGSHFSHSPWSLSPQPPPTLQPPVSPHGVESLELPPSCYKRHLSWPTSPSQQPFMTKFDFQVGCGLTTLSIQIKSYHSVINENLDMSIFA